jgi:N-terminal domain of anti-restriction factor ArdC
MASNPEVQREALTRAQGGESGANYRVILEGFIAKGIAAQDIRPRENVFTYNAWQALGRQVRKGEKGVRCLTFIDAKDKQTGQTRRRPWHTSVFHVSQTDAMNTSPNNTANRYLGPVRNSATQPVQGPVPCSDVELDATGENVEHAGETEPATWDARELAQQRVDARRARTVRERVEAGEAVSILDIIAENKPKARRDIDF